MRIAFISPTAGLGGGEMMMLTLATWCRDVGHHVLVLAPQEQDQWIQEEARRRAIPTHTFQRTGPLDVRCLRDIAKVLRSDGIELVHGHMFTGAYFGVAAARLVGIRSVVTFHGGAEQTDVLRRRIVIRWAIRNSDAATVVSEKMRSDLATDLGERYGNLQVVVNGMPAPRGHRHRVRDELLLRDDERLVVAIGSCCERKNHVALVAALSQLEPSLPWRLAICGREDDATPAIKDAIALYGVEDRVHLLGVRLDTADVLAAADVFAMPSLWEGTPLALIEAMMAGKACVASSVGGIPEMIEDGVSGMLVDPLDLDGLCTALTALVANRGGVSERLGEQAAARAAAAFGLQEMCERYHAIYNSVLATAPEVLRVAALKV